MASTLDDKLAEEQIRKSLEEQFSSLASLARKKGVGPLARPTRMKTSRAPPATSQLSSVLYWRHPLVSPRGDGHSPLIRQ